MSNRIFCLTLGALLVALSSIVEAQHPKKIPRIGVLGSGSRFSNVTNSDAFREGLRELGYVETKNIVIEWRYAEGKIDRLPDFAAELVRLNVDVIVVAGGVPVALAAQQATRTIPIVTTNVGDPVARRLIASLARPGGNITGLTSASTDLSGKRLELLKETVPRLGRAGVLWEPDSHGAAAGFKETVAAARPLEVQVQSLEVRIPEDFESAFKAATGERARGLIVLQGILVPAHRIRVVELATNTRLPTMFAEGVYVESGGLMSYGPSYPDLYRRAAIYVDKILKGVKPGDLPVEQPRKFEFIINLKTAKQIGLTIPLSVLARADRVIK